MGHKEIKVLLIEDSKDDYLRICTQLTKSWKTIGEDTCHFSLAWAQTLNSGLEKLKEGGVDAVLLSLSLPEELGMQAFRKVRSVCKHVPILTLSSADESTTAVCAVREGAQDYIVKSALNDLLVRSVVCAIERQNVLNELNRNVTKFQLSEDYFRKLIQENADGMVVLDTEGTILFANPAAEQILDKKIEDLVGEHFGYPINSAKQNEIVFTGQSGKKTVVEVHMGETLWLGERVYLTSLRDITGRKHLEWLQASQNRILHMIATGEGAFLVLNKLIRMLEEQHPGLSCSVLLLEKNGKNLRLVSAPSLTDDFKRVIDGMEIGDRAATCGAAAARGERVICADMQTDPSWANFRCSANKSGLSACWSQPFMSRTGQVLGTFAMYWNQSCSPDATEVQLVETVANLVGIAIEHDRAEKRLLQAREGAVAAN